ncbi:MAG: hypothetical protein ACREJ2_19075 [Planctomycetota bacterium]
MTAPLANPSAATVLRELRALRHEIESYIGSIKNSDTIPKVPEDPQVVLELFGLLGHSFRIGLELDALDIEPDREIIDQLLMIEDVVRSYSRLISREMLEDIVMYQLHQLEEAVCWVSEIFRPHALDAAALRTSYAGDFLAARDVLEQAAMVLFFLEQVGRAEEALDLAHHVRCFGRQLESLRLDPHLNRYLEGEGAAAAGGMSGLGGAGGSGGASGSGG